ncbi:unnamed protein product [Auanema sp. JU1783]|nr:unnamed protein product [Auanema sp. JU1783]
MNVLCGVWLLFSLIISFLQLLTLSQPEWIVNGYNIQGLFVVCSSYECVLRPTSDLLPFFCNLIGTMLFALSSLALIPILLCSHNAKPIQFLANIQIVAALLMTICLFTITQNMSDIDCTISQLLRSSYCRIGWAMAVSAICCMLSICCPVFGKLVADQRKEYRLLRSREHYI